MIKKKYDFVVIGAGILGTFHAYHALKRGKSVLLLEKDSYPTGATVRNFGQVVPSGMSGNWFEHGKRSTEIYKSIQQEFDISVRNNGSVYLASDEEEQTLIHELKAYYDTKGYEAILLSKENTLKKYPAVKNSYVKEAIYFPQEISIEPDIMIHRLHDYMRSKFSDLNILYNTPAIDCVSEHDDVQVNTSGDIRFHGSQVIICNGYEFKLLYPEVFVNSGQTICKLQMMRTVPMPEVALEGNILTGLSIRRYESFQDNCPSFKNLSLPEHYRELQKWGIHVLFKKAADGSMIIGDSHEYSEVSHFDDLGFDIKAHINTLMLQEAQRIVNFDVDKVNQMWVGFYPQHNEKHIFEYDINSHIHIRNAIGGKGMTASAGYAESNIEKLL